MHKNEIFFRVDLRPCRQSTQLKKGSKKWRRGKNIDGRKDTKEVIAAAAAAAAPSFAGAKTLGCLDLLFEAFFTKMRKKGKKTD